MEIHSKGWLLRHKKTGARVMLIESDDGAATQAVRATDMAASFSFLFVMIDGSFQIVSSLLRITTVPYNGHISRLAILLPLYHFLVQVVKKKCVETHDL